MNHKLFITVLFILLSGSIGQAQKTEDKTLMTVDGKPVSAGEFIRMYKKSSEPGNKEKIDTYLDQFVIFKLKVADAIHEGYDTTKGFRAELKGYRDQLAQSYLTDPQVKENLLKKAYQRSLTEINAWHILVAMSPDASPDDTLKAWKKARDIKERIVQGEPFEQVARSSSDDPSVRNNGGNLGYFTVFQMITPFEDAVYAMKKGQISDPVRTPYGYHIIYVANKRPSSGKIKVAHIMKAVPPGASEKVIKAAEDTILAVYKKLTDGASFSEMAARYSDHKESASRGGEINWFGAGEIISDFAEPAFALQKNGDFTKPVRTVYGWHIIKRIDRKPPGTMEETRQYLESRINESYLNSISKKSFIEKLKKDYKYRLVSSAYNWFIENTDTMIIKGLAKYNRQTMPSGPLYLFADQQLPVRTFAAYIEKRGSMIETNDPVIFINKSIDTYLSDQIINYENSVLEKKYPEFRYLMNEFHDGILLFEISGEKVWNKSQDDSSGLKLFYEKNKMRYLTRELMDGKVYSLKMTNGMKQLSSAYSRFSRTGDPDSKMIKKFNTRGDTMLSIYEGSWKRGANPAMETFEWKPGIHQAQIGGYPALVSVKKITPPSPLPLSEVRGEMISEYQDYLEKEWIRQLKEKYTVKIEKNVLDEVRKIPGIE
jgi:peptidyl-prolyl cis-trans isomerase SurA